MSNNKETVKVRLTTGDTTVEIETTLEGIEEAVRRAILGIQQARVSQVVEPKKPERRGTTCLDLLERLVGEGWFSAPRSLSEVVGELARRGYHYDPTAVSHGLLDLVRREVLVREGKPKRYVYREAKPGEREGGEARVEPGEVKGEATTLS
ncbi:MAG: hypothetical protein RMJ28_00315 [Nitrososphaerota archaeon]|nr:hypothetical protein [Candidatus Calditenuaceae archaeon]MDW8072676.1 hypothetical protein [Nitrososphaerota archaeon]